MGEEKNICSEHGVMCYKLDQIQKLLSDLFEKVEDSVTKEELNRIICGLEKDIAELKRSDKDHYRDIGLIREAISGIYKTLEAYQQSQTELKQDYKNLFDIINKIYILIETHTMNTNLIELNSQKGENEDEKPGKINSVWGVLGIFVNKNSKYLLPVLWFIIAIAIMTFIENRQEILKAIGLM